jgi:hypothetical protein
MKDKIPTVEFTDKSGEFKASVYEWITQDEDDEYMAILTGGQKFEVEEVTTDMKFMTSYADMMKAKNFRIRAALKTPSGDEVLAWPPKPRAELIEFVTELLDKKK